MSESAVPPLAAPAVDQAQKPLWSRIILAAAAAFVGMAAVVVVAAAAVSVAVVGAVVAAIAMIGRAGRRAPAAATDGVIEARRTPQGWTAEPAR
jgi:hypothetical protein